MLFLHANLIVKKVCELLLSPIHQVKGFFCGYEVIGLYSWRKNFQYLLHGRLGGLQNRSGCVGEEINPVAVLGIHNFIDIQPVP
jgi:hypothetical protein